ncbi:MAG TPA: phosphatidylglycerophosphatase A, partial [Proteobacteria bacterium]|nr:phosphatidylglycerophosphatase A [Pseudomonadota bacterium]
PGGLGVMADDLAAGLYARLLLLGAAWLLAG